MRVTTINMRLYRRFDADLIALHESGIPVNVLAEILLDAYAEGRRISIIPDGCTAFDVGKRRNMHLTIKVRSEAASKLISQIKYGFRNQFCKSLVRDALKTGALWVYLSDSTYVEKENQRIKEQTGEDVIVLPYGLRKKDYWLLLTGKSRAQSENKQKRNKKPDLQERQPTPVIISPPVQAQDPDPEALRHMLDDIEGWGPVSSETAKESRQEKTAKQNNEKIKENSAQQQQEANYVPQNGRKEEIEKTEAEAFDILDAFDSIF